MFIFKFLFQPNETQRFGKKELFTVDVCMLFVRLTHHLYICDCPAAAASLKFLKQEGLVTVRSMESVKLPGYRGNGLEGVFKETVAQQLLHCRVSLGRNLYFVLFNAVHFTCRQVTN